MNQPQLRMGQIPEGYIALELHIPGQPNRPQVYVCNRCGCMIGSTTQHNQWHIDQEKLCGTITRTKIENFDDFDTEHNQYKSSSS